MGHHTHKLVERVVEAVRDNWVRGSTESLVCSFTPRFSICNTKRRLKSFFLEKRLFCVKTLNKMNEEQQLDIKLVQLKQLGIKLDPKLIAAELTCDHLADVYLQSLNKLGLLGQELSKNMRVPDSMSERYNFCMALTAKLQPLGLDSIQYSDIMYPNANVTVDILSALATQLGQAETAREEEQHAQMAMEGEDASSATAVQKGMDALPPTSGAVCQGHTPAATASYDTL